VKGKGKALGILEGKAYWIGWHGVLHDRGYEHSIIDFSEAVSGKRWDG
jgi:hypothetical protein